MSTNYICNNAKKLQGVTSEAFCLLTLSMGHDIVSVLFTSRNSFLPSTTNKAKYGKEF